MVYAGAGSGSKPTSGDQLEYQRLGPLPNDPLGHWWHQKRVRICDTRENITCWHKAHPFALPSAPSLQQCQPFYQLQLAQPMIAKLNCWSRQIPSTWRGRLKTSEFKWPSRPLTKTDSSPMANRVTLSEKLRAYSMFQAQHSMNDIMAGKRDRKGMNMRRD